MEPQFLYGFIESFDLTIVLQSFKYDKHAPVAQSDRASDFGSEGWGFESLRVYC